MRVEIDAVIHRLNPLLAELTRIRINRSHNRDAAVSGQPLELIRADVLRAREKDCLSIKGKDVRALPHETDPVFVLDEDIPELPLKSVPALIDKDLAAAVSGT